MVLADRRSFLIGSAMACAPLFGAAREPVFRAGLLTDTHITDDPKSCGLVRQAMALFKREKVDLICHLGDLADVYSPKGFAEYRRILETTFGDKMPETYYAFGGHDRNRYVCKPGEPNREVPVWNEMKRVFKAKHELYDLCEFRGYAFVIIQEYMDRTPAEVEQARALIKRAVAEHPNQPVFVLFHEPALNTVDKAAGWGNAAMLDLCRRHPQIIHISGHTHGSVRNEREIWQGSHTEVNAGCLQHWLGDLANCPTTVGTKRDDGVLTMEVYPDAVVFHRFSVTTGEEYKPLEPWTVPLPHDPKTAPYRWSARKAASSAPAWPAGARLDARWVDEPAFTGVRVVSPLATRLDNTYRYTAVACDAAGRQLTLTQRDGEYWKAKGSKDHVVFELCDACFKAGETVRLSVRGEDFFGNVGPALETTLTVPSYTSPWRTVWREDSAARVVRPTLFVWKGECKPAGAFDADGWIDAKSSQMGLELPQGLIPADAPAGTKYRLVLTLEDEHAGDGVWKMDVAVVDDNYARLADYLYTPNGARGPVTYVFPFENKKGGALPLRVRLMYGMPAKGTRFRLGAMRLECK